MRNLSTATVSLPADPVFVEFPRSDGDDRTWKGLHTSLTYDPDGQENWMLPVPSDHPTSMKWRLEVGRHIALDKGLDHSKAVLKDWPQEYKMFDHHKGFPGKVRHDIYLYGPPSKRFRSIKEFVPHAIWLMRDDTLDTKNCACKYCTKRSQKEISQQIDKLAATPSATPTPSAGPSQTPKVDLYSTLQRDAAKAHKAQERNARQSRREPRPAREPAQKVFAAVQKKLRPVVTPSDNVLRNAVLAERNDDLRAVYSSAASKKEGCGMPLMDLPHREDTGHRRWFRKSEIVWAKLPGQGIPIPYEDESGSTTQYLDYWPAIIESWTLKAIAVPPKAVESAEPSQSAGPGEPRGLWDVKQCYNYRVHPLAGSRKDWEVRDIDVLPYLAKPQKPELLSALDAIPKENLNFDRTAISEFDPVAMALQHTGKGKGKADGPPEGGDVGPQTIYEATAAFILAAEICHQVQNFWSLSDRYDFYYRPWGPDAKSPVKARPPVPPFSSAPSISTGPRATPGASSSLTSALQTAGQQNAASLRTAIGVGVNYYTHHDVSRVDPNATLQETNQSAVGALGALPKPGTPSNGSQASAPSVSTRSQDSVDSDGLLQVRYQGLWWGPERIWEHDFVRLKLSRGAVAPNGARHVFKPSGPGNHNQRVWEQAERIREKEALIQRELDKLSDADRYIASEVALRELPKRREEFGAIGRGTFMRIESFFSVDVIKDGKVKKEMRATGMLYELADHDWEEGDDDTNDLDKGKGPAVPRFEARVNEALLPQAGGASTQATAQSPPTLSEPTPQTLFDPQPPHKYKFRPILASGYEAVVSISTIAGRYYPRICCHPFVAQSIQTGLDSGGSRADFDYLFALEGLVPGHKCSTDPEEYRKYRKTMIEDADDNAMKVLHDFLQERFGPHSGNGGVDDDVAMDDGRSDQGDLMYPPAMDVD